MEDQNGNVVPPSTRKLVTRDIKAFWREKTNQGIEILPFTRMGWDIRTEFRDRMEHEYPWLRLCEGHWKCDQLWIMTYKKGWKEASTTTEGSDDQTQQGSLKREHSVEEDQAGPSSKRAKIAAVGKLARHKLKLANKVCSPSVVYTRLLNTSHR